MVKCIIRAGHRIELLPPPAPGEDLTCLRCGLPFNPAEHRRACYVQCPVRHVTCLKCALQSTKGCGWCLQLQPVPQNPHEDDDSDSDVEIIGEEIRVPGGTGNNVPDPEDDERSRSPSVILMPLPPPVKVAPDIFKDLKHGVVRLVDINGKLVNGQIINVKGVVGNLRVKLNGDEEKKVEVGSSPKKEDPEEPEEMEENPHEFWCMYCHISLPQRHLLGEHYNSKHGSQRPFKCDICQWPFATRRNMLDHRATHGGDVLCQVCGHGFETPELYTSHLFMVHGIHPQETPPPSPPEDDEIPSTGPSIFPCPHCPRQFEFELNWTIHQRVAHADLRPYVCPHCKKNFPTAPELGDHRRTHFSNRSYKCHKCPAKYHQKYNLEIHVRLNHMSRKTQKEVPEPPVVEEPPQQAKFPCEICQEPFILERSKEEHLETVHHVRSRLSGEELAEEYCPECQSKYDAGSHKHLAFSGCGHYCCLECVVRDAELGCGQCTTETAPKTRFPSASPSPVKKPPAAERVSGRKIVKPLRWRDEEEGFPAAKTRRKSEEENGGRDFRNRVPMKVREEPGRKLKSKKKGAGGGWGPVSSSEWTCRYCPARFREKTPLALHMFQEHGKFRRYPCQVCQWPFESQKDLRRHMRTHGVSVCAWCAKTYRKKEALQKHLQTVHGNQWRESQKKGRVLGRRR